MSEWLEVAKQLLEEREPGELYWLAGRRKGKRFGGLCSYGYRKGGIRGRYVAEHQLIWLLHHGRWPTQIDHINRDRVDNRIENLREVTDSENQRNRGVMSRNLLGEKGIRMRKGRFNVRLLSKNIGTYETIEEARNAYRLAGGCT